MSNDWNTRRKMAIDAGWTCPMCWESTREDLQQHNPNRNVFVCFACGAIIGETPEVQKAWLRDGSLMLLQGDAR